jgi:hypothetical protein
MTNKSEYMRSPASEAQQTSKTSSLRRRANEEYKRKMLRDEIARLFGPTNRELVKKYLRSEHL